MSVVQIVEFAALECVPVLIERFLLYNTVQVPWILVDRLIVI